MTDVDYDSDFRTVTDWLFRYRSAGSHALEEVDENYVWCGGVEAFNDPFEFEFNPVSPIAIEKWQEQNLIEILSEKLRQYGVACFVQTPISIHMWSHYASSHTGVVIEYDSLKIEKENDFALYPINYSDAKPTIKLSFESEKKLNADITRTLTTKYTSWSNENEVRYFSKKHGSVDLKSDTMKSVIFGLSTCEIYKDKIRKLAEKHKFNTFQTYIHESEYRLYIQPDCINNKEFEPEQLVETFEE